MNAVADMAPSSRVVLLDVRAVAQALDISVRSVWRLAGLAETGHGCFPRPLHLGPKLARWRASDLESYTAKLAGERGP